MISVTATGVGRGGVMLGRISGDLGDRSPAMARPDSITINGRDVVCDLTAREKDIYEYGERAGQAGYRARMRAAAAALPTGRGNSDCMEYIRLIDMIALFDGDRG